MENQGGYLDAFWMLAAVAAPFLLFAVAAAVLTIGVVAGIRGLMRGRNGR